MKKFGLWVPASMLVAQQYGGVLRAQLEDRELAARELLWRQLIDAEQAEWRCWAEAARTPAEFESGSTRTIATGTSSAR